MAVTQIIMATLNAEVAVAAAVVDRAPIPGEEIELESIEVDVVDNFVAVSEAEIAAVVTYHVANHKRNNNYLAIYEIYENTNIDSHKMQF